MDITTNIKCISYMHYIFVMIFACVFIGGGCTNIAPVDDNSAMHLKREIPAQNPGGIFFELDEEFVESYNEYLLNRIKEQSKKNKSIQGGEYKRYEFGNISSIELLDEVSDVKSKDSNWKDVSYIDPKGKQYLEKEFEDKMEKDELDDDLDIMIDEIYTNINEEAISE